jgi:hypothetical protein
MAKNGMKDTGRASVDGPGYKGGTSASGKASSPPYYDKTSAGQTNRASVGGDANGKGQVK